MWQNLALRLVQKYILCSFTSSSFWKRVFKYHEVCSKASLIKPATVHAHLNKLLYPVDLCHQDNTVAVLEVAFCTGWDGTDLKKGKVPELKHLLFHFELNTS